MQHRYEFSYRIVSICLSFYIYCDYLRMYKHLLNNMVVFLLFFCVIVLSSCSNSPQEDSAFFDLKAMPSVPLTGELVEEDFFAYKTTQMKYIQSSLFHFEPTESDVCLVTSEQADTIGFFSGVGSGPGEMIEPYYSGISENEDTIYVFDDMTKKLHTYSLQVKQNRVDYTLLESKKLKENNNNLPDKYIKETVFFLTRMGNGYSIGYRVLTNGTLFSLFDPDLNEITKFGEYPIDKGLIDGEVRATTFFGGSMEVRDNSFFFASHNFGYMVRYDIGAQGEVTKVWERWFTEPKCRFEDNNLKFNLKNEDGFYKLVIGKKYIYATFSGIPLEEMLKQQSDYACIPRTLVVFDWNGNVKGKFNLNNSISALCLDDKEEYLYVRHDEPDVSLWKYKVSDILEHL